MPDRVDTSRLLDAIAHLEVRVASLERRLEERAANDDRIAAELERHLEAFKRQLGGGRR